MPIVLDQIKGLADSKWNGIQGAVAECVGLDIHSTPGITKVHQQLAKDSGSTVDEFCRVKVSASNGYTFWFSYTSGKIWARSSAGSWTLAYTTTPAAGSAGCLGASEFNGYIYWATQSRLHRIAIGDADDSWASVTEDYGTFDVTNSEFHPMVIQDITLLIGDGNQVAAVDEDGNFDSNALDLPSEFTIKTMAEWELDILIGTIVHSSVTRTSLIRWDCISTSWNTTDPIEEVGINAFIRDDNYLYVQAGKAGRFYFYDGSQLIPLNRIPGDWTNVKFGEVHPNSWANFRGIPIFGLSNSPEAGNTTGNPAKQGVYSFGSYSRNYSKVMDLSWIISQDKTSSIEIGAISVVGEFEILVAWKDGSNYGVDILDWTTKYDSAYFETMMLFQDRRNILDTLRGVAGYYASLPANTGLTFYYSINGGAYVAFTSVTDAVINRVYADLSVDGVGSLQIKVAFTTNSNDAPQLEALEVLIDGLK